MKQSSTLLYGILFLFFLQAITDFISSIYAFGLLSVSFTIEVAAVLLLFSPVLLLFLRGSPSRGAVLGLAVAAILARLFEPMLDPRGKLFASGVSVAAFMLLFPILLERRFQARASHAAFGLALATAASMLLRTVHSSVDISMVGMFQIISWALAAMAFVLLWRLPLDYPHAAPDPDAGSTVRVTRLAVGLASVLLMIYFAFSSPAVMARWTGSSYIAIIAMLAIAFWGYAYLNSPARPQAPLTRRRLLIWNVLFLAMLMLTILPHQITFPADRTGYPLDASAPTPFAQIPLYLMLLLSPVLYLDFMLYARQISLARPTVRQMGTAFSVAAFVFLCIVFFHVFTTVYDYAPIIGPVFRDRFWLVYLLAGLGMTLPMLVVSPKTLTSQRDDASGAASRLILAGLAVFSVAAACLVTAKPEPAAPAAQLKVMTWNIQQGFDQDGNAALADQLRIIRSLDPDVLGLQESDTARISNGNVDAVRYFADQLGMYSYYGPSTTTGTFGIALLSKYPIESPRTFFMYSEGEQTAAIHAEIRPDGAAYNVLVTHLGNGGPPLQLEDVLINVEGLDNVILMGDFNFSPASDQYVVISQRLEDAWFAAHPDAPEVPGLPLDDRIDLIFITPGMPVADASYSLTPESDHPFLYVLVGE